MMIGRADERETPLGAQAFRCRLRVWGLFAKPIWASGHQAASKAGHMTAVAPLVRSCNLPLAPKGPFSNRASPVICVLRAAVGAIPGSRFSPRSTSAAATSGPKHRRCNVHNGLTWKPHGPTASLAVRLHPRPGGQPSHPHCRPDGSRQGRVRRPRAAPTSGTARRTARCCAGSPTACGPARHAPCRRRTASRSPAPSPSGSRPA